MIANNRARPRNGFILIASLLFLLVLGLLCGGLFNQVISAQQQANLIVKQIVNRNSQKSLLNHAKHHAQQLIVEQQDLTQMSQGFTPDEQKDVHPLDQWAEFKIALADQDIVYRYRLIYLGTANDANSDSRHWFTLEQSNPQWHQQSLPSYTVSIQAP